MSLVVHGCQAADPDDPESIPDGVLTAAIGDVRRWAGKDSAVHLSRMAVVPADLRDAHGRPVPRFAGCTGRALVGVVDVDPSRPLPRGHFVTVVAVPQDGQPQDQPVRTVSAWPLADPGCGWAQVVFEDE